MVTSDTLTIHAIPDNVSAVLRHLAPVSLNRGAADAPVVEIEMRYEPSAGQAAPVEFGGIVVGFADEGGAPIPVQSVALMVRLRDESKVLCSVPTGGVSEATIALSLAERALFKPGAAETFRISMDIAPAAAAQNFRLVVQSAAALTIADHNSGVPVPFTGTTFPWAMSAVTLNDPATTLAVRLEPRLPGHVNRGQERVAAFDLILTNASGSSAADMSVSEITFMTRDDAGDSIDTGKLLRSFRLDGPDGSTLTFIEGFTGSASVRCRLQPPVVVSAQGSVALHAGIDCLIEPGADGFSVALVDSLDIAVRDVNSGRPADVRADPSGSEGFPMSSGRALFRDPLREIVVAGSGLLGERITAGGQRVPAIRVMLRHPGNAGESPASLDSVTIRFLDETGRAIKPGNHLSAIRIGSGDSELATVYVTAEHSSDIPFRFSTPMFVEPGSADTFDISIDLDESPTPGRFQMHVNAAGLDIVDATDGRRGIDLLGNFPLTSGLARVIFPAQQVLFEAVGLLPANVAAGEEIDVFRLRFSRVPGMTACRAFVRSIAFDVLDRNGASIDPVNVIADVRMTDDSGDIGTTWTVAGGRLRIDITDTVSVADGEVRACTFKMRLAPNPSVSVLSLRVSVPEDVSCTDEATGGAVAVSAASGAFPFSSGRAAILGRDLAASFSNYPNPFVVGRETTRITFYLPTDGAVTLKVYTVTGEPVRTIADVAALKTGLHQEFSWDGRNGRGETVLNGVYYLFFKATLDGREHVYKRKVAVVR